MDGVSPLNQIFPIRCVVFHGYPQSLPILHMIQGNCITNAGGLQRHGPIFFSPGRPLLRRKPTGASGAAKGPGGPGGPSRAADKGRAPRGPGNHSRRKNGVAPRFPWAPPLSRQNLRTQPPLPIPVPVGYALCKLIGAAALFPPKPHVLPDHVPLSQTFGGNSIMKYLCKLFPAACLAPFPFEIQIM